MWNPDKPGEKPISLAPQPSQQTADEYQTFRRYMMDSTHIRKAYGIAKDYEGNFWIDDVSKGMAMEGKYRTMLKQFCEEMQRAQKFIKKP